MPIRSFIPLPPRRGRLKFPGELPCTFVTYRRQPIQRIAGGKPATSIQL